MFKEKSEYLHLSDTEHIDLLKSYYLEKEVVRKLKRKYGLDDPNRTFASYIPPLKSKNSCPKCQGVCEATVAKSVSRSNFIKVSKDFEACYSFVICKECGHTMNIENICNCDECYYERITTIKQKTKEDLIKLPLSKHGVFTFEKVDEVLDYFYICAKKFTREYATDIDVYAYPSDKTVSKTFCEMITKWYDNKEKKLTFLVTPENMKKALDKYIKTFKKIEIKFSVKNTDAKPMLHVALYALGSTVIEGDVFDKKIPLFSNFWLGKVLYNEKERLTLIKRDNEPKSFKTDNVFSAFEYIKNNILDYEFDMDISPNSKVFDFETLEKRMAEYKNSGDITITMFISASKNTLVFSSYALFDTIHYEYNPYYPRSKHAPLLRNIAIPDFKFDKKLSQKNPCNRCGRAVGSSKKIDGKTICVACQASLKSIEKEKQMLITPDGRKLTGKEALREKVYQKKKLEQEIDIKEGRRFVCNACKRAIKIEHRAKNKNVCFSCAKHFAELTEIERSYVTIGQRKVLDEKRALMTVEEKGVQASKEQDMIAEFLRKKAL